MSRPSQVKEAKRLVQTYESAKRRSKDFNLSYEYIHNILSQTHCAYSGELFDESNEEDKLSLERWNNSIGYIEGNVIAVKKKYNSLRSDLEIDELIKNRNKLTVRISNGKDAPRVKRPLFFASLKTSDWHKIKRISSIIKNIESNIKRREAKLKEFSKSKTPLSKTSLMIKSNIEALIHGGKNAMGVQKAALSKLINYRDAKKNGMLSDAVIKSEMYDIIIKGLTKFENMSTIDKLKINKGLPINASLFQLIKGKI